MSFNSYIIKRLDSSYRSKIYNFLLKLDQDTIYKRFCGYLDKDALRHYVSKLNFDSDGIYAVFDRNLKIVGLGECFLLRNDVAELGFCLSLDVRGKGLGLKILETIVDFASAQGRNRLIMICLKTNTATIHLAKKMSLDFLDTDEGERVATLDMSHYNHNLDKYRVDFKDKVAYYELNQRKIALC